MTFFDGHGNEVAQRKKIGSGGLPFWDAPKTYAGENGRLTADEIITTMFDTIMVGNEEYITKTAIGKDASGTYDLYEYIFTPHAYTQTIWLQSGVHSREKAAVYGLAKFLNELANNWKSHKGLAYIRSNVRLVVIPIVNPWGLSQENPSDDANSNGVNLNRDNFNDNKQPETIAIQTRFALYKDVLSFALDFHTTVNANYGDYAIHWAVSGAKISNPSNEVVAYLCEKNIEGEPDLRYHGVSTHAGTYVQYFHGNNIPGVTLEHSDYTWDTSNKYAAVCIQRSTELVTNAVVQYVSAKYKILDVTSKYYPKELTVSG